MIPSQLTDSIVPICAGLFVSLVNKYILSIPKLDNCCTTVQPEEADEESDSTERTKNEMTDTLSKTSATTTATLPLKHPIHAHHIYYVHH